VLADAPKRRAEHPTARTEGDGTVEWDALVDAPKDPLREPEENGGPRVSRMTPSAPRARASGSPTTASHTATASRRIPDRPTPAPAPPPPAARAAAVARPGRYGDEDERPVPTRRVSRTLPPPPPPPGAKKGPRRSRRGVFAGILLLVLLAGAGWLLVSLFEPLAGDGGEEVRVSIPANSAAADVGDVLAEEGVVSSSFFFSLRTRLSGAELKAGDYTLRQDMSYADAIAALEAGPPPPETINVTIPEGQSRRETAAIIRETDLRGSYLEASQRQRTFNPRRYGAPRSAGSLEGFLFPATFELEPGSTANQLVRQQLGAFRENIQRVDMSRARERNLTVYDVLIIASMVEREASIADERRLVSAVIHNRLREGMPLGIDATIRFATRNWSRPLRQSELDIDSPYNTRKNTGLPPGPIGSPGLESIRAAANPADVDYLYYVVKPGGDGAHNFSSTDEEFQRHVAEYHRERQRRGGRSPAPSE
jgi:UPF0755 protein